MVLQIIPSWHKEARSLCSLWISHWMRTDRGASQVALVAKNLPANGGDARDSGSIPGLGRSPGVRNGTPLQYSCLESPMDGGAW